MLHIKKNPPSSAVIRSVAEIKSLPSWRHAIDPGDIREHFDYLNKDAIRACLLEEQHGLCAYCMKRISNDGQVTSIEHWAPLSKNKGTALDYNNFLAVCKGGSDIPLNPNEKRVLCCDAHKGDGADLSISPFDKSMMDHIAYDSQGVIKFLPKQDYSTEFAESVTRDINHTLQLNGIVASHGRFGADTTTRLRKGRKDAYDAAKAKVTRLRKKGKLSVASMDSEINSLLEMQERPEYAGVSIFVYQAERKRLLSR